MCVCHTFRASVQALQCAFGLSRCKCKKCAVMVGQQAAAEGCYFICRCRSRGPRFAMLVLPINPSCAATCRLKRQRVDTGWREAAQDG